MTDERKTLNDLMNALKLPPFMQDGDCVGEDARIFDDEDPGLTFKAKRICSGCPVQQQCAVWGIANEPSGVWGGLDTKDLQKARKGKRKFVSLEQRQQDLDWIADMWSDKSAADLAIKYGKTERTIYRWRSQERKRMLKLPWAA